MRLFIIMVCCIVIVFNLDFFDDSNEEALSQELYCSYVDMWSASGQNNGHPDYKKVYGVWCK